METSRKLPYDQKVLIAKSIVSNLSGYETISLKLSEKGGVGKWQSIAPIFDKQRMASDSYTPADVAMCFLYYLSFGFEGDLSFHSKVVEVMIELLEVSPEGSLLDQFANMPAKAAAKVLNALDDEEEQSDLVEAVDKEQSGCNESPLLDSEIYADYGEDLIDVMRRCCREIFEMAIIAEDDLSQILGSFSQEEFEDYGAELIEIIRRVADDVRLELGGHRVHGYRCPDLTKDEIDDYGLDLIDVITRVAYEEANSPQDYVPLYEEVEVVVRKRRTDK